MNPQLIIALIVALIVLAAMMYYMYMSRKGMCNWTQKDGFVLHTLKNLANSLLFGIPGVLNFI